MHKTSATRTGRRWRWEFWRRCPVAGRTAFPELQEAVSLVKNVTCHFQAEKYRTTTTPTRTFGNDLKPPCFSRQLPLDDEPVPRDVTSIRNRPALPERSTSRSVNKGPQLDVILVLVPTNILRVMTTVHSLIRTPMQSSDKRSTPTENEVRLSTRVSGVLTAHHEQNPFILQRIGAHYESHLGMELDWVVALFLPSHFIILGSPHY